MDDPVRRSGTCQHGRAASRPRCGLTPAPAEQTTFKAILLLHVHVVTELRYLLMVDHEVGGRLVFFLSLSLSPVPLSVPFFLPSSSSHVPTSAVTPGPHHRRRPLATHAAGTKEGVGEHLQGTDGVRSSVQGCVVGPPSFLSSPTWVGRPRKGRQAGLAIPPPCLSAIQDMIYTVHTCMQ